MKNSRLWVFRLTDEGYKGSPESTICPILSDKEKKDIKKYCDEVDTINDSSQDYGTSDLIKEFFDNGKLRQGWGLQYDGMSMDLNQVTDDDKSLKIWLKNYVKLAMRVWGKKIKCRDACGRYGLLKVIKDMEKGHIVLIPRVPDDDHFTIAEVKKRYYFEKFNGFVGHGHVIEVYKNKTKVFEYGKNGINRITFMPYRKAVDEIREGHIIYPKIKKFIEKQYI